MISDTAAPALFTALHLAMAILRRHRASGRMFLSPFVLPSFLFIAAPWVWPTPLGIIGGFGVHAVWLFVCEWLAPPRPQPARVSVRSAAPDSAKASTASGLKPTTGAAFVPTTVLAVLDEAKDIKTFRLARPEGFEFSPGQFLAVRVQIDGKPHVRCYSISSAPHSRGYLEISVRRQGLVSGTLHATVRVGAALTINRPAGQFVYPTGDDRPLALIAGGIGITPLLSMLRHATATDPLRPVTLLYSVRGEQDVAFYNELRVLAERHPHLGVVITLTQPKGPTMLQTGVINADMLRQYVPAPAHTIFCLCGPPPMIEAMRHMLAGLGVPDGQIRYERFNTAAAASLVNTAVAPAAPTSAAVAGAGSVRVTFDMSHVTVSASSRHTLLETAEAEGVSINSSCRSGVCQSCRTRLTTGRADCRSDVLDPEDRANGYVLPCVTWPQSDCALEA